MVVIGGQLLPDNQRPDWGRTNDMTNAQQKTALVANLQKTWEKLASRTSMADLLWLAEVAEHLPKTGRGQSETLKRYRDSYETTIAYSGRKSLSNGDAVATFLEALSPDQTMAIAERLLGLEEGELAEKYQNLNEGSKRMNAGNRIRGAYKRGDLTDKDLIH